MDTEKVTCTFCGKSSKGRKLIEHSFDCQQSETKPENKMNIDELKLTPTEVKQALSYELDVTKEICDQCISHLLDAQVAKVLSYLAKQKPVKREQIAQIIADPDQPCEVCYFKADQILSLVQPLIEQAKEQNNETLSIEANEGLMNSLDRQRMRVLIEQARADYVKLADDQNLPEIKPRYTYYDASLGQGYREAQQDMLKQGWRKVALQDKE